ncbi:MAG: SDR family NAD(P)-dependent oxidoreductase [Sporolactobacillus sp.]|jgi:short-subunit dehydrogenase|nr:SDR family NAD(P)-dependent oxidoreductase [Sporolactobacillus sp.]
MRIAVITGASSGIGREFVRAIDAAGLDEIWLIARRKERLEAIAKQTKTHARPISLDLTTRDNLDRYQKRLQEARPEVAVLINSSGYGVFGGFQDKPLDKQLGIIDLNDRALTAITYLTLPFMKKGGEIYNLASTASFQPLPYGAVYAASKAFAFSFTRALNMELKPQGIHAIAVCPHWCKTDFFATAITGTTVVHFDFFNRTEDVVAGAIRAMKKGKDISLCGARVKFRALLIKLLPQQWVMKIYCRMQKKPY